jgi:hypothetical protein
MSRRRARVDHRSQRRFRTARGRLEHHASEGEELPARVEELAQGERLHLLRRRFGLAGLPLRDPRGSPGTRSESGHRGDHRSRCLQQDGPERHRHERDRGVHPIGARRLGARGRELGSGIAVHAHHGAALDGLASELPVAGQSPHRVLIDARVDAPRIGHPSPHCRRPGGRLNALILAQTADIERRGGVLDEVGYELEAGCEPLGIRIGGRCPPRHRLLGRRPASPASVARVHPEVTGLEPLRAGGFVRGQGLASHVGAALVRPVRDNALLATSSRIAEGRLGGRRPARSAGAPRASSVWFSDTVTVRVSTRRNASSIRRSRPTSSALRAAIRGPCRPGPQ